METINLVANTRQIVTSRITIPSEWYFYFILLPVGPYLFFCCSVPFCDLFGKAKQLSNFKEIR